MKNKKFKNFIFLFIIIFFALLIGVFNFCVDSTCAFKQNEYMELFDMPHKMIPFAIEHTKDIKNETLLLGFSEPHMNLQERDFNKEYFNQMFFLFNNYKRIYEYLEQYLSVHPETKYAKFFVSYNAFLFHYDIEESFNRYGYFDKWFYLLFSKEMTMANYTKLYWENIWRYYAIFGKFLTEEQKEEEFLYPYIPNSMPSISKTEEELDELEKENFEYIDKILTLFDEKKIEYEIIIPQYNAAYLAVLDIQNHTKRIERIKRYFVNRVGIVYDFAFVNRLTSTNMLDGSNYIYYLLDHPNKYFGYKLFKFLFFREDADKRIYLTLTKKNIDKQLKKEEILLKNFIKNNQSYVYYYTLSHDKDSAFFDYRKVPKEFLDDKEYIENKITEKNSKQ